MWNTEQILLRLQDYLQVGEPLGRALRASLKMKEKDEVVLVHQVEGGIPLSTALQGMRNPWLTTVELEMVKAGEESGTLPQALAWIIERRQARRQAVRSALLLLVYPVALLHLALIIVPPSDLQLLVQTWDFEAFLLAKLKLVLPMYVTTGLLWLLTLDLGELLCLRVPGIKKLWQCWVTLGVLQTMIFLTRTPMGIVAIWKKAAQASGSKLLQEEVKTWRDDVMPLQSKVLPALFILRYEAATRTGKLDEALITLKAHYEAEFQRTYRFVLAIMSNLVYAIAVVFVAISVIFAYLSYFNQVLPPSTAPSTLELGRP